MASVVTNAHGLPTKRDATLDLAAARTAFYSFLDACLSPAEFLSFRGTRVHVSSRVTRGHMYMYMYPD